jgi:hypothetical protein
MGGVCGTYGRESCAQGVKGGNPDGKKPWTKPRHPWEDNIKINFQKVRGCCGDWMELAQDGVRWWSLVSTVMNFRVP